MYLWPIRGVWRGSGCGCLTRAPASALCPTTPLEDCFAYDAGTTTTIGRCRLAERMVTVRHLVESREESLGRASRGRPHRRPASGRRALVGLLASVVVAAPFLVSMPRAFADVGLVATSAFPVNVVVGQTDVPASIQITNSSTAPENQGDVTIDEIMLDPSCGVTTPTDSGDCPVASADPGVFQLSATGVGDPTTACANQMFAITPIDTATGQVRFSPMGAPLSLASSPEASSVCGIDFTFDVLKLPTVPAGTSPPDTVETANIAYVAGTAADGATGKGSTSGVMTVADNETPTTMTGRAFGVSSSGLVDLAATPDTGEVAMASASATSTPCAATLSVLGMLTAQGACADVTTTLGPATSTAEASAGGASVGVLFLPAVTIGHVQSTSTTNCTGSSGSTTIGSLSVGSLVLIKEPKVVAPNTTFSLGMLTIVVNEQVPITGPDSGLTVNALHVTALGGLVNLIAASSSSAIAGCL
jgi:hypothetical protein